MVPSANQLAHCNAKAQLLASITDLANLNCLKEGSSLKLREDEPNLRQKPNRKERMSHSQASCGVKSKNSTQPAAKKSTIGTHRKLHILKQ
jgi:hypothetical protein